MNPLEQVLARLCVNWAVATPLHAGGRWALGFVGRLDLRVEIVVRGRAHVTVGQESFIAEQGDCYVIAGRRPYRIAGDPDTPAVFAAPYYDHPDGTPREVARVGEGHDTTLLGAGFTCDRETARLLEVLPPVIHVRDPGGTAQATIQLIKQEIDHRPIVDRLCQVLLLQVLRDHDVTLHPQLGPALQALHADVGRSWTVGELAAVATMSRSTFFVRFKEAVGMTPLDYLHRLRMQTAARALKDSNDTVATIAFTVGYRTESAFSAAFRRFTGSTPSEYRVS